jgi:hypothetical protein
VNNDLVDELDRILSAIHPLLAQLAVEHRLEPHAIERWHWDAPEISLSWLDGHMGLINKSLRFYVDLNGGGDVSPFLVKSEVNAWQDLDAIGGAIRRWQHQTLKGALEVGAAEELRGKVFELIQLRDRGYETVSRWRSEDLTRTERLPPLAIGAQGSRQSFTG